MHKSLVILCLLTFSLSGFSQKVKIKDHIATVDGVPYLNFVYSMMEGTISISGINSSEEEIFASFLSYKDPKTVTSSNPKGTVSWIELNFLGLGVKCEIDNKTKKCLSSLLF